MIFKWCLKMRSCWGSLKRVVLFNFSLFVEVFVCKIKIFFIVNRYFKLSVMLI